MKEDEREELGEEDMRKRKKVIRLKKKGMKEKTEEKN